MEKWLLFIDGSVNTGTKIGFGAYLLIKESKRELESLKAHIKTKRFENTSSTKLELQTLLWALEEIHRDDYKIIAFTDSQNILSLPGRRELLEKNNYYTSKKERLNNHELYQQFYKLANEIKFELVQVQGHQKARNKNNMEKFFTLVDRAARKAQRKHTKESKNE